MQLDLESAVHDWISEYPQALHVLEELGIDTSCGGVSLAYACRRRDLDPSVVIARLRANHGEP